MCHFYFSPGLPLQIQDSTKLLIPGDILKEYFAVVLTEDAAVANLATLAEGKYL